MKAFRSVLDTQAWHVTGPDVPIQLAVKYGAPPRGHAHLHKSMHEYFLVLKGEITLRVDGRDVTAGQGDLVIVEPGEAHEMVAASPDSHFVLLIPRAVPDDKLPLENAEGSER